MCDVDNMDVELFIMEVEKRPCIWDFRTEDYKDRKLRDAAWYDICGTIFQNFEELPDSKRKLVSKKLQLKWRNVRDYYRKYTKKYVESGSGAPKKFKYIFADKLHFLAPLLDVKNVSECSVTNDADTSEELVEDNCDGISTPTKPARTSADLTVKLRSKLKQIIPELKLSQFFDNNSKSTPHSQSTCLSSASTPHSKSTSLSSAPTPDVEDEDRSFFDSILPVVRSFDMDQKLEFRSEVLRVLQLIRRTKLQLQRSYPQYQTSAHPFSSPVEYPSTSYMQMPNIYNLRTAPHFLKKGPTAHSFEKAHVRFTKGTRSQNQNNKMTGGELSKSEPQNTESPESDASPCSDDNQTYSC